MVPSEDAQARMAPSSYGAQDTELTADDERECTVALYKA